MYRCPAVAQASWHAAAGLPTYEYQFNRAAPGREAAGAVHGAEVPYVFGTLGVQYNAVDRQLSDAMQTYWTNFAKTGDPNGRPGTTALPRWPRFDDGKRQYLEFTDEGPMAREGLRRPYCDLYLDNLKRLQGR